MALSFGKRAGNTLGLPVRIGGTALYGGLDVVNTVVTLPKQSLEIVSNTTKQIKDVLSSARSEKKWYHKIWKAPLGTIMAAGTAVEGLGRAIVNPVWNTTLHTRDVLGNFLVNPGNAIKSVLSDKPVSEFKYEHLKTRDISKNNRMSGLFLGKGGDKKTGSEPEEKKDEVVTKKDDKKSEDSKGHSEKEIALEKKVLSLEDMMKKLFEQQEKTNKQLAQILSAKESEGKILKGNFKKENQTNQNPDPKNKGKKITMNNNNRKKTESDENGYDEENIDYSLAA